MEGIEKAKQELERLIAEGKLDAKLANHPNLRNAFIDLFVRTVDHATAKVTVEDNAIVVKSGKKLPEETNGIYHGYSDATKCKLSIEMDGDKEFLTVLEEVVNIYSFDNKSLDSLSYSSAATAYADGLEVGHASFSRSEEVMKNMPPEMMIYDLLSPGSGSTKNPTLNVYSATRGFIKVPFSANQGQWRTSTSVRDMDGIALETQTEHKDERTEESIQQWAHIGIEHPERLSGNTSAFAVEIKKEDGTREWVTPTGEPLTQQDIDSMKVQYNDLYTQGTTRQR